MEPIAIAAAFLTLAAVSVTGESAKTMHYNMMHYKTMHYKTMHYKMMMHHSMMMHH